MAGHGRLHADGVRGPLEDRLARLRARPRGGPLTPGGGGTEAAEAADGPEPPARPAHAAWPALPFGAWRDTCQTLHLWTQIVGKVRLARTPWINHSWHVALYVGPRGLTTSLVPAPRGGTFQVDFDLVDHLVRIATSEGREATVELRPRSVADFHAAFFERLRLLGIHVEIHGVPNELPDPIPFAEDEVHGAYDAEYAGRFARVLSSSVRTMLDYRGRFRGKSSPVHFFWGSFDLAVTRFSGRPAPEHPGGIPHLPDWVVREAYSHEVASAGFWPGSEAHPEPTYYAYAYPAPEGYTGRAVRPGAARWHEPLSEFVLPYDAVRTAEDPAAALDAFLESTYVAAAECGGWDRRALEWPDGKRPPPEVR